MIVRKTALEEARRVNELFAVCFLQRDPALPLKRNAGNCKTDTVFCMIVPIYKQYIKLRTANAAKKQKQCAEDQKRPIAGERRNDGCGQERQAEQQRQQPLLQQRRGPRKDFFHIQHRSKTICLCR